MSDASFRSSGDLAADRRFLWAQGATEAGDAIGAADLFRQVLDLAPDWASAWYGLGQAQEKLGQSAEAITAYQRCLMLEPEDILGAGIRLRLLGAAPDVPMSQPYVRALFDSYADRFDAHLVGALGYCAPALLMEALHLGQQLHGTPLHFDACLDIGCGTGLMGVALKPFVTHLAGVDLAPGMIAKARQTGVYDHLAAGDAVDFLRNWPRLVDLVIAADVLVYIGDLLPLFRAVADRLNRGGLFAFTVQDGGVRDYDIGADSRYAHGAAYLEQVSAATGFCVRHAQPVITRRDAGKDVPGRLLVLAKI